MTTPTVSDVIGAYVKLRDEKDRREKQVKEEVQLIKEKMAKLEGWIRQKADADQVTSFKTEYGTAFLTTVDFASVADWDAVLSFIKENEAYDLLERRVSKTAVRGYIEERKSVPNGITYGTKIELNVRRPTAKIED